MTSLHCCSLLGTSNRWKREGKPASNSGCLSNVPMKCHCHMVRTAEGEKGGGQHDLMENGLLHPSNVCGNVRWCWGGCVWVMCIGNIMHVWSFRKSSRTGQTWCRAIHIHENTYTGLMVMSSSEELKLWAQDLHYFTVLWRAGANS